MFDGITGKIKICRFVLFFWWAICQISASAQPPAGYYDSAEGLTGKYLQQSLHDIIDNHMVIPYADLYDCFRLTDVKSDSLVWDMYSDKPGGIPAYLYFYGKNQECGNYDSESDCFNREHSFPKSWFNDAAPMLSDLFHLYPTDGYVNNRRANYPFGETKNPSWTSTNGSKTGPCSFPGYSGIIFEPIDEYKGDFARTFFYMAVRYFGEDKSWTGSDMVTGAEPKSWAKNMLLAWHRKDTVSLKEAKRNNAVFSIQKNRNPFIDKPQLAEKIWALPDAFPEIEIEEPELKLYPNPTSGYLNLRINRISPDNQIVLIYSAAGVMVRQFRMDQEVMKIETGGMHAGMYLVRVVSGTCVLSSYFVKVGNL
jgi:endonuclease I